MGVLIVAADMDVSALLLKDKMRRYHSGSPGADGRNSVQFRQRLVWQSQFRRGEIFAQMRDR